jgi:hypothetical protein
MPLNISILVTLMFVHYAWMKICSKFQDKNFSYKNFLTKNFLSENFLSENFLSKFFLSEIVIQNRHQDDGRPLLHRNPRGLESD